MAVTMAPARGQAETEGVQCFYQAGARPADPAGGGISVWLVFRDRIIAVIRGVCARIYGATLDRDHRHALPKRSDHIEKGLRVTIGCCRGVGYPRGRSRGGATDGLGGSSRSALLLGVARSNQGPSEYRGLIDSVVLHVPDPVASERFNERE